MPDGNRGGHALLRTGHRRTSYEPRHGKVRQAGTSFGSQTFKPVGSGYESQTCRTSVRYGLNRNACTDSSIRRISCHPFRLRGRVR